MKRIVLTGGPGAGKTVIANAIVQAHPDRFVLVPEAATRIYQEQQTRWDRLDVEGRKDIQRRIYRHQIEQEDQLSARFPDRNLLLDRGTIDGSAYWPDGPDDYWREMGTTRSRELARYDAVIWLESAATLGLYDGDKSNQVRFEDAKSAVASGQVLLKLWEGHPNLRQVGAYANLVDKIRVVEEWLMGGIDR